MPPNKRKAAAAAETKMATRQPAKRVRVGDTSTIGSESRSGTPVSGRPRRSTSNDTPQYNFTRKKASNAAETKTTPSQHSNASNLIQDKASPATKRRGRPPRNLSLPNITKSTSAPESILKKGSTYGKSATHPAAVLPKRRGRPPKTKAIDTVSGMSTPILEISEPPRKKPGRKPRTPVAEPVEGEMDETESETDYANVITNLIDEDGKIDESIQYWLMKAEPESRIEQGVDVKFSIDDLAAREEPEGWDGVRNPVARNNMRAMRAGDLAFFYHSNCTTPGIVGVMRVVEEHQVDETAFDPNHPYYDPKSTRDKPKWEMVKVEFVKKFDTMMTLKELKSFAGTGGMLEKMQTLKQSRLSVSGVQPAEWQFILEQLRERYDLGHLAIRDGYESDTDSEAEQGEEALDEDAGAGSSLESDATDNGVDQSKLALSVHEEKSTVDDYDEPEKASRHGTTPAPELPE